MYAVRFTRPDVAFAQNLCNCFQQNPSEIHWTAVKIILKYLMNTKDMILVYGAKHEADLRVSCYADATLEWLLEKIHMTWAQLKKNGQGHDFTPTILMKFQTMAGDGIANIKLRRQDHSRDGVKDF
ncbi:hypothetical protein Tco_0052305 [Tanacetum coccineum]